MTYANVALIAVPTANKEKYMELATSMAEFFKSMGALEVAECWGVDVPDGKLTSFPMAVQLKADETVVCSWIKWPSKEAGDAAFAKMESGGASLPGSHDMPFDGARMIFGGFEMILEA